VGEVRKVFDAPSGRQATRKIIQLRQNSRSVADYEVDFRTLAAESAWNQQALFDMFLHGISEEVKDELASRELPTELDSLIASTTRIDERLQEQRRERILDFARTPRYSTLPLSQHRSFRWSRGREDPSLPELPRGLPKTAESLLPKPMSPDRAGQSKVERQYRIDTKSCLYCRTHGHFMCPLVV
jgi:hypothetical protein